MRVPTGQPGGEMRWRGVAAAPGVALGPAHIFHAAEAEPPLRRLAPGADIDRECCRLDDALATVGGTLHDLRAEAPGSVGTALAKIFDAQLLIVEDETIRADVRRLITAERISAESAFARVVGQAQEAITGASDPYLREMATDIQTIKRRVINHLLGLTESLALALDKPAIVLAHTITPTDIMSMKSRHILGIVAETGGATSHTALFAKSLGIPAVVGVGHDVRIVPSGARVVVNGYGGMVIVEPDAHTVDFFERKKRRAHSPWPKRLDALRDLPAITLDRHPVELMANIDLASEVQLVRAAGAGGVGLYRTEYLFLQRGGYPSEARQRATYRRTVADLGGLPLVVRTFDLGSDKVTPEAPHEPNPALGFRGLRISLARPKTLAGQFRALLAASADGPIWVMVPMVTSLEEFVVAKREWNRAKSELRRKKVPFDDATPFGLMIETPAAVWIAAELAAEADFFSIGTNDLIQYSAAVDRGHTRLAHLLNHWHPALWRQLDAVVAAARAANIPVGVCGEMASDPLAVPALVGLGMTSLSAHPNSVPKIKSLIRSMSYTQSGELAREILTLKSANQVQTALKEFNRRIVDPKARLHHG